VINIDTGNSGSSNSKMWLSWKTELYVSYFTSCAGFQNPLEAHFWLEQSQNQPGGFSFQKV